jgi:hypothetical protein
MNFKTFFLKNILLNFFISTTCIGAAMAVMGLIFEPDTRFGYGAFLSPLIYGALAILPQLVMYSKKELTVKQVIVRRVVNLILLEMLIVGMIYSLGAVTNISVLVSVMVSVLVIYLTVNIVRWVSDNNTAKEFNAALKTWQDNSVKKVP